ncbi:UDP-N-acetylglucosamine-peptide N-acetylglucosaminyltransferase [Achlya hypogyna]|uniref:protein O-GlcNAc transferase n=1 Tax=Achlya hypogyna TaxID=1202772 RepID=A0A1V9Z0Q4_ACHHY|nr:UDP-N-acetylglucosamine-peptide N-acetylglucosaminyltransferase [Achlya hypogyna]
MATFHSEAAHHGVDPARLLFAPRVAKNVHLSRLRHAHLFLDTFVYTAHSTATDALWASLPLLTLEGGTFAARVAASLLRVALGDAAALLVTHSAKAYEDVAVALATTHRRRLGTVRAALADAALVSPLFDSARTTADLEAAYALVVALAPARSHVVVEPTARWTFAADSHAKETAVLATVQRHHARGAWATAEVGYRRLLAVRPTNADALHGYGLLLHHLDRTPAALPLLLRAVELTPHVGGYRTNFGHLLLAAGDEKSAMEQFSLALHLEPTQFGAFRHFVRLLAKHEQHPQLIEAHARYGQLHVDSFEEPLELFEYYFQLSFAHAQLGDAARALDVISHHVLSNLSAPAAIVTRAKYNAGVLLQTLEEFDAANDVLFDAVVAEHAAAFAAASPPSVPRLSAARGVVAFYCNEYGHTWWPEWGPSSIARGVGGSEEAVIYLTRELAAKGYDVRVFAQPPADEVGRDAFGVGWYPHDHFNASEPIDVFVSWRYHISVALATAATKSFVWLHDVVDSRVLTERYLQHVTGVVCLTHFHAAASADTIGGKLLVVGNGVPPQAFAAGANDPQRFVYGSAPNRGLSTLLLNWPLLRARLPSATLHVARRQLCCAHDCVYYGFTPAVVKAGVLSAAWREHLETLLQQDGIVYHGLVDHATLAQGYANAGFYLYPTTYPETSCVSIMKAMAAGAIPITSRRAALAEVVGHHDLGPSTPLQDDINATLAWVNDWIEHIVAAVHLSDAEQSKRRSAMKEHAQHAFLWSHVADKWSVLFQ